LPKDGKAAPWSTGLVPDAEAGHGSFALGPHACAASTYVISPPETEPLASRNPAAHHAASVAGVACAGLACGVAGPEVLPCVCSTQFASAACHTGGEGAGSAPDTGGSCSGGGCRVGARCTLAAGSGIVGRLEAPGAALRTLLCACIIGVGNGPEAGSADTVQRASRSGAVGRGGVGRACKT